ncbi:MAG: hypothetical protein M1838_003128 [Thelocarpon superellum]|nr:MAG: hypothetical protein M1838_003128 [Thelocarpon superellum]
MGTPWDYMEHPQFLRPDEPVVLPGARPPRFRHRMFSDDYARPPAFYPGEHGGMFVPEHGAGMHRTRSTGPRHGMPAAPPVVFNNFIHEDDLRGRPLSVGDEWAMREHSPFREHSRHGARFSPRAPSPFYKWQSEAENEHLRKQLDELKREKDKAAEEERLKQEMILKLALKEKKEREDAEKRKEIEKQAIIDFKRKEVEEKEKKKKEEAKREEEYRARLQKDLGLTETQVARIVKSEGQNAVDLRRTTYTKIARRHVSIETLREYNLPFKFDDHDPDHYVLIKRWVPEYEQELLWDHTKRIREERTVRVRRLELTRVADERRAKLLVAKKRPKSPGMFDFIAGRR